MNRNHLQTLTANVNRAIRDHETVTIGSGRFHGAELETLAAALSWALQAEAQHKALKGAHRTLELIHLSDCKCNECRDAREALIVSERATRAPA
jgi:hypothetical protein